MTKYKPGDVVIIRPDLQDDTYYAMEGSSERGWITVGIMVKMAGQMVTIAEYQEDRKGYVIVEDGSCWWTDGMFLECIPDADWEPENIDILGIV